MKIVGGIMDSETYVILSIIVVVLWFVIGLIVIVEKMKKKFSNFGFQFRCVCDDCKETFTFPYEFIKKHYFRKSKEKVEKRIEYYYSGKYTTEECIVFYPKYKKYAKEIVCPKCNKKGMVRVENLDEWTKLASPYSKRLSYIYTMILLFSTFVVVVLLKLLEPYIV